MKLCKFIGVVSVLVLSATLPSQASSLGDPQGSRGLPAQALSSLEIAPTIAPLAFVKFCMENAGQCESDGDNRVVALTPEIWSDIVAVNATINRRIRPDESKGSYDWSLVTSDGNCNDYAVQKRKALIDLGLPVGALSLTVVKARGGIGHLILTVRTDRGDFVLDNLRSSIVPWTETGYQWIKRQSAANPKIWTTVRSPSRTQQMARRQLRDKIALEMITPRPSRNTQARMAALPQLALAAPPLSFEAPVQAY